MTHLEPDDALRLARADIMTMASRIAIQLAGVRARYGEVGSTIACEVIGVISSSSLATEAPKPNAKDSTNADLAIIQTGPTDLDIADNDKDSATNFILNIASAYGAPVSVQQFYDALKDANIDITRSNLVVKLHRLVKSNKLTSPSTGHFRIN